MKLEIQKMTTEIFSEENELLNKSVAKTLVLYPDEGKKLKNIVTGKILPSFVIILNVKEKNNYIDIEE